MSEEFDNFWDPYCPCKVTRKNVVMTILTLLCFALVFWTIIQTSIEDDVEKASNVTQIKIPSSKTLDAFKFT